MGSVGVESRELCVGSSDRLFFWLKAKFIVAWDNVLVLTLKSTIDFVTAFFGCDALHAVRSPFVCWY